jgi:hypothetical protein
LPPLKARYGDQLEIAEIDISTTEGWKFFESAVRHYGTSNAIPMMVVGDAVLIGSRTIERRLPVLIEEGLAAGGVDWPDIPGFVPPDRVVWALSSSTDSWLLCSRLSARRFRIPSPGCHNAHSHPDRTLLAQGR